MQRINRLSVAAVLALVALTVAACSSDSGSTTTTTGDMGDVMDGAMDMDMDFAFGSPADAADADRTIEITATDELRWKPATIGVKAGETVTFRVTNQSQIAHDFTLGDEETQTEHEAEMADMGGDMMMDEANAFTIDPGEAKEITWTFGEAGTVLIACHEPGHYAAGMISEITVAG